MMSTGWVPMVHESISRYSSRARSASAHASDWPSRPLGMYADTMSIRCRWLMSMTTPAMRPDSDRMYERHRGRRWFEMSSAAPAQHVVVPAAMTRWWCVCEAAAMTGSPTSCSAMTSS